MNPLCHMAAVAVCIFGAAPRATEFECRWVDVPITIDGRAEEAAWETAQTIDDFYLPWLGEQARAAKTATRARLLWDRQHIYFFADMDDTDLYADVTEHDGRTWTNDVFELFFKPADDKPGYYEFQVSAAGTVLDMFLPRRNAGGYQRFARDGPFHVQAQVTRRGTLNKWQDRDQGWSVEGRIPWTDFLRSGGRPEVGERWKFALCRYDYAIDFEGPELSTCAPLGSRKFPDFHHFEDYATLRFVGPSPETAARPYGLRRRIPLTTSRVAGSPEPPLPYRVVRALPQLQLDFPIFVINQPGTDRLLFIDQTGSPSGSRLCRTIDAAAGRFEVLLELSDIAYSIAFHPQFADNGLLFVGSNGARGDEPKKTRVTRYTLTGPAPGTIDRASARVIIEWESDGHNGGAVVFGQDGMLYVTSGDGTSDSDDNVTGQGLDHLLAKVLRIDVDRPTAARPYSIPPDNPFLELPSARGETWAYGFRNPWRMCVDPRRGHIWVGNNGQDLWEQAFLVERGANYGWSVYEGSHPFYLNRQLGPTPHVPPTLEHPHSESRSLTGGVVYYGDQLPQLQGAYIYGDYSTGKIWGAQHDGQRVVWHRELADTTLQIAGFGLDARGELLIVDHQGGQRGGFYALQVNPEPDRSRDFPRTLTASGLFRSVAAHQVQPGLIPYSVNAPLWSDGSYKERYIALPESAAAEGSPPQIEVTSTRGWNFPDGTVLVKSFALEMEEGRADSRRWIETRFLAREQGEWVGYSYQWNDQQTEATLVARQGRDQTFTVHTADGPREQAWRYPSRSECMVCHSRAANFVLGLSTLQMNKDHDYGGVVDNQLRTLESLGVLRMNWRPEAIGLLRQQLREQGKSDEHVEQTIGALTATRDQRAAPASSLWPRPPAEYPRLVDPYDAAAELNARARSYLHANCSICHVEAGGGNAQMNLEFTSDDERANIFDVPPLHHTFGLKNPRLVAPGSPQRSVLLHRVALRGSGQMPQLATSRVDREAVELLAKWIRNMPASGQEKR